MMKLQCSLQTGNKKYIYIKKFLLCKVLLWCDGVFKVIILA